MDRLTNQPMFSNPSRVEAVAQPAKDSILFVDDEELVLSSYQRVLRKQFRFDVASSGQQALDKIASDGPYAVMVSDMRMPGMSGIELLRRVKVVSPRTIRIMLTGNSDVRTAIDAVNEGSVFRFLTKPCDADVLTAAIKDGLRDYHLLESEKELLEQTLQGSIRLLTEVLGLLNPAAFNQALEISKCVKDVVKQMELDEAWQYEMAALLANLGSAILASDAAGAENKFGAHAQVSARLLRNIPRLDRVASIIGQLGTKDQTVSNANDSQNPIRIGAAIIRTCADFHAYVRRDIPFQAALRQMREASAMHYLPAVLNAIQNVSTDRSEYESQMVNMRGLAAGMVLDEDLRSTAGTLLVARGTSITESLMIRLQSFSDRNMLPTGIRVLIPDRNAADLFSSL
jgi:FixJ family two-component response regulator